MVRRRRSQRRVRLGARIASIVRNARLDQRPTMTDLAERSGVSRQMVGAVESGWANPSLDVIGTLLDALDVELEIHAGGPIPLDRPSSDAAHAICSGYIQRRLVAAGWEVVREVRIEVGRYLGLIDLLAFHAATGTLVVIEVKSRVDDVGAIERSISWHARGARRAAARLGWRPRRVVSWLLALASDEVEASIRQSRDAWARGVSPRVVGFEQGS